MIRLCNGAQEIQDNDKREERTSSFTFKRSRPYPLFECPFPIKPMPFPSIG